MSKSTLEALFEGLGKGEVNDELKGKLTTLINETVDARVGAKEKLLTEEVEALKTKLLTEAEELKTKLLTEAENNEKVLVEQAEKYKKELEEAVIEETVKYKAKVEKERDEELTKYRAEIEAMVLEEAKNFKETQDAALVEEVKKFKAGMVDKVSDYLEAKLTETVPAEIMESAAKLKVLEPLVQGVMESFSKNFVKLDTTSFKLIKEAKEQIDVLEKQVQEKAKAEIALKKEIREVQKNMKVKSLTEGLTQAQKEKAVKLLEGVEVEELEGRWAKIRDIVIEDVKPAAAPAAVKPVVKPAAATAVKLEESKKVETPVAPKATPIADAAVIDHQVKKVLNEGETKDGKASVTPQKGSESIQKWASKVKPSYVEDHK
jgi:hypothetical protein